MTIQAPTFYSTLPGGMPLDKAFSPSFAIEAILHKYLDIFKRFRGGDHPYLPQLVEAVKELPKMAVLSFDRFLREMGLFSLRTALHSSLCFGTKGHGYPFQLFCKVCTVVMSA